MQALLDAIAHAPLQPAPYRVFHGRGGLHTGCQDWAADFFDPVWLTTVFRPPTDEELAAIGAALRARWQELAPGRPLNWVLQQRHEAAPPARVLAGSVPEPHIVAEEGALFELHLLRGQNHGFFLDMARGRHWLRQHVAAQPGLSVLNLFAYSGAFSVVALQAGAGAVLNVDMSAGALATAKRNHALNGVAARARFMAHDIFSSWAKLTRNGPYDLVIADPPSFQKGSFVARKDWARLARRLPALLQPGGHALLALNAPELDSAFLRDTVSAEAPSLQFVERLPNPPAFADVAPERALKVLIYRAPA
jgi:23S rRNA (cytosine1962-C5)-methyltransferase